ncbi:SpoIIE family protein phosphatase [Streptomyces sp. NBC_00704]|uniref:SpoIIE family protein phosphatase n=1 Tax=Streptomyces sp. NBC_00704 TaxID=2975809 RepID=UPI003FA763B1
MTDAASADPAAGFGREAMESLALDFASESGASVVAVYLLAPDEPVLQLALLSGLSWRIAVPWARVALDRPTPIADAVRERRLVWIGSEEERARSYPRLALVLPHPFALAAAPVTTGPVVWGGLVVHWPASHQAALSPRERDAVHDVGNRLGVILRQAAESGHRVRAGTEPRLLPPRPVRTATDAEAQAAVGFAERLPDGCCALDVDGRITFITTAAAGLLGVDVPELLGARPWEALPWLDIPVAEDRYRSAALSREPTSFTARRPPDHWLSFHLYPDATGISVRVVPAEAAHTADPPRLVHPAPPVEPGRATALYALTHVAVALTEAVGVSDVVERVADQVLAAFDARALALMTVQDGRLRIVGHRGYGTGFMERFDAVPVTSDTPAVHVLTTGIPSFFADFAELKRAHPTAVLQDGMASWAFLPLITTGRPVGSMVLAYDRPHPFAPQERSVLTALAGLIAQALSRAHLYDAEHHLARNLQAGLLPHALPHVPGLEVAARYLPAGHGTGIGGDFYDFIRLDDTSAAAAIGDVQGHNVQAATLMGQVRTAVHATAGAPPGEVLGRTNRLLTDLDPGLFTSCTYVALDTARHHACLATAGHPPPLLRRPDGRTDVLPLTPGLLLGIDPAADYPATEVSLPPGTVLALYTDGLVEAPGVDLEDAVHGLADALSRADTASLEALADHLVEHTRPSVPQSDDIALLLIRAL